jgi:hypothetical protein
MRRPCADLFAASEPLTQVWRCSRARGKRLWAWGNRKEMHVHLEGSSWHRRVQVPWHTVCCLVAVTPVTHPGRAVRSTFWFAPPARSFSSWI